VVAAASDTPKLILLTRPGCGLCEEMEQALIALGRRVPLPGFTLLDVDSDPVLRRRHGLEIPVLLVDGIPACRLHLDAEEVLRLLRPRF
jgi:hypothetical protein